jgi:alpha-1,6-mannosyltransferase
VLRNGGYVSVGSWAHPFYQFFNLFLTPTDAKIVVGVVSYAGLIVIAWMLSRTVPWTAVPGLPKGADLRHDPLTIALRTALVLSVAWLVTSMYTLSWYDLIAWVPLAVLATNKLDRLMLVRGAALSLAYVPGRAIEYGPALDFTAARIRDTISPVIQLGVLLAVVLWWRQPDRPELFPFRRPTATAPEPAPPPAKPPAPVSARSTGNGRAGSRTRVTTHKPPAPARSGSRRR